MERNIYELPELPTINYGSCSLTFNVFNMETQQSETKVFSFLELALLICPKGKGKILVTMSYPYEDKDTGPSERTVEAEISPTEFLLEVYSETEGEYEMLESMKQDYRNQISEVIIEKLNERYLITNNCVTC